jgi:HAD superfamily hydrolase (TIGR01450 family)
LTPPGVRAPGPVDAASAPGAASLAARHDALLVDLDGVVYRGDRGIPGAGPALDEARGLGARILFITNNSSRTPEQVAETLAALGVQADPEEVLTSGLATAALLRREGWAGRSAFVIGELGVREALRGVGIEVLEGEPNAAELVVIGWDRSVDYAKLRTAALLVQRGARLVATNADRSYPAPDGLWPGAGAILAAVTTTTGASATVVGKPARPMFEAAAEAIAATRPLVIGDRLDTDVSGAAAMGWDSLLVLSGAARPHELLTATALPTYLGPDLGFVLRDPPPARFRTARPEDTDRIRALLEAAGLSERGVELRTEGTIVCEDPGDSRRDLAATASLEPFDGMAILRSVAVRTDLRGAGLGMLVTAEAIRRRPRPGPVALFSESAEPFFRKLGFRRVERSDLPEAVRTSSQALEECSRSAAAMVFDPESEVSQAQA